MRPHAAAVLLLLLPVGCGSSAPPPTAAPPPPATTAPPIASATAEPAPTKKEPAHHERPPLAIANLTVAVKKQGEQRVLDLAWDVTRHAELPATVIFVHSACKVGYGNKYEDSSVSGVEAIPPDAPRAFKTSAFAVAPLPFDPAHCSFAFAYGPKGSKDETKLASFCWKKGAVSDGPCG
jgi:hypothetical protein